MKMSLLHRFTGHVGSVYALEQGPEEGTFFSGAGDRIVAKWNVRTKADGDMLVRATDTVYSLCYLAGRNRLLVGQGQGGVHVVDLAGGNEERLLKLHDSAIFRIESHAGSNSIVVLSGDGTLSVLDPDSLERLSHIRLTEKKLRALAFHPDGKLMLVGCGDGSIVLFGLPEFKILERFGAHSEDFSVNAITFSPDGSHFLSGSRDAHIHLYETGTLRQLEAIPAHNYAIYDILFDPSGRYFASASRDKTVKLWDYNQMKVLQRLEGNDGKGHVNSVNKLLWLPDGTLLSAGDDRAIQAWTPEQ